MFLVNSRPPLFLTSPNCADRRIESETRRLSCIRDPYSQSFRVILPSSFRTLRTYALVDYTPTYQSRFKVRLTSTVSSRRSRIEFDPRNGTFRSSKLTLPAVLQRSFPRIRYTVLPRKVSLILSSGAHRKQLLIALFLSGRLTQRRCTERWKP